MSTNKQNLAVTSPTSASQTFNLVLPGTKTLTWIVIRGTNTFSVRVYKTFPWSTVAIEPVSLTTVAATVIGSGSLAGTYQADFQLVDSNTANIRVDITNNTGTILVVAVENAG